MRQTLLLLLAAAACSAATGPQLARNPRLDEPFQLGVDGRAVFEAEGFTMRFVAVTADSRCPSNAFILCVWAGDGAVLIEAVTSTPGPVLEDTLHTTLEPRSVDLDDLTLELVRLDPYPQGVEPIPADEYVATFVVRRSN